MEAAPHSIEHMKGAGDRSNFVNEDVDTNADFHLSLMGLTGGAGASQTSRWNHQPESCQPSWLTCTFARMTQHPKSVISITSTLSCCDPL